MLSLYSVKTAAGYEAIERFNRKIVDLCGGEGQVGSSNQAYFKAHHLKTCIADAVEGNKKIILPNNLKTLITTKSKQRHLVEAVATYCYALVCEEA